MWASGSKQVGVCLRRGGACGRCGKRVRPKGPAPVRASVFQGAVGTRRLRSTGSPTASPGEFPRARWESQEGPDRRVNETVARGSRAPHPHPEISTGPGSSGNVHRPPRNDSESLRGAHPNPKLAPNLSIHPQNDLTSDPIRLIYALSSEANENRQTTVTPPHHLGRQAQRRRPEAGGSEGGCAPSGAARGDCKYAGSRDDEGVAGATQPAAGEAAEDLPEGLSGGKNRFGFRLVHFSVQKDHFHLIAEAPDGKALARGLQGLAIRLAKGINRGLGRKGRVFRDRYHLHVLRTPREVRHALSYVLNNAVRHGVPLRREGMPKGLDGWSSARWFSGWSGLELKRPAGTPPVVGAKSWLLKNGWRRAGPVRAGVLSPRE